MRTCGSRKDSDPDGVTDARLSRRQMYVLHSRHQQSSKAIAMHRGQGAHERRVSRIILQSPHVMFFAVALTDCNGGVWQVLREGKELFA